MNKKGSRANAAPLLCWDIFMETLQRRDLFAHDISTIQKIGRANKWPPLELSFENALIWENKTIVVTDPSLKIIHATENLVGMTGYSPAEVIGKTPKMFQGIKTGKKERALIREAINQQKPFDVVITNYKKDGTTYACHVEAYPIFNQKNELVNFIAYEKAA